MKNLLGLVILFTALQSFNVNAQPKECTSPLLLLGVTEWYPYMHVDAEGQSTGADVELLRSILRQLDCEITVVHLPERRAMYEMKKGNFDVWLGASLTQERLTQYHFSKKYRNEVNQFAYQTSDTSLHNVAKYKDIIDLKKIVGINLAGWYGPEIEKSKMIDNNYIFSDTVNRRLKMLARQRVDVVIDDYAVLCSELARAPEKNISIHSLTLFKTPIYFIFNKKNISPDFVEKFDAVLDAMSSDGRLTANFTEHLPAGCNNTALTH